MAAPVQVAMQNHTETHRNLLNPASGTYTNTRRNSSEPSGTFRTLPLEPTQTRAGTLRNPREPSKTFRNQPFGTFRNLPPEPAPATRTGTHRSLSGLKTPLAHAVGEKNIFSLGVLFLTIFPSINEDYMHSNHSHCFSLPPTKPQE